MSRRHIVICKNWYINVNKSTQVKMIDFIWDGLYVKCSLKEWLVVKCGGLPYIRRSSENT